MRYLITIDGGAQTGKSTAARELARWLQWDWVSTGAFYRGLACVAELAGIRPEENDRLVQLLDRGELKVSPSADQTHFFYQGRDITPEIFTPRVGEITPLISRLPEVRERLLHLQRALVDGRAGLVAEGRDCGTVVFPEASLKFYFTVSDEAAARRFALAHSLPYAEALTHVRERNERDTRRATASLKPAPDAIHIDTSELSPSGVITSLQRICSERGFVPQSVPGTPTSLYPSEA